MSEIQWPDVASRMAEKVEDCCGCSWAQNLTDEERDAVLAAMRPERREQ